LRVLTRIVDNTSIQNVDRLIKTSLVHKSLYLKQSAVVSCVHLMKKIPWKCKETCWRSEDNSSIWSARSSISYSIIASWDQEARSNGHSESSESIDNFI